MSKKIDELEEVSSLYSEDQFLFFQNSTKKTKKISRSNMFASPGVSEALNIPVNDTTAPATPGTLTVTTTTEKDRDGTEKVYIKAVLGSPNTETDLAAYRWYIRRISGTPVFNGSGNLTGYGGTSQIFGPTINDTPSSDTNALKMVWDVRANTWYEVAVAAVDKSGNASAYTTLTSSTVIQSSKDTTAPAAPTSVSATAAIKSVFLSWTNPTDADLAYINIYRNTTGTAPTIGTTVPYAKIMSNSYVDSNTTQGTTYYYWLTSVDYSGNETATTSTVVSIAPGLVANTDITTFAVDATKMFTNTVILKADVWTDNSPYAGYIAWNAHTLVYGGASYDIIAGNTNLQFVYWKGVLSGGSLAVGAKYIIKDNTGANFTGVGAANNNVGTTFVATGTSPTWGSGSLGSLSYTTVDTNPTLTDGQFMIATNAKDGSDNPTGIHDLAWNAIANAVIGSAYIQNAAITNAKVSDLAADKITSGSIDGKTITLIGDSVIKSSSATSGTSGSGLWIKGLAGGGSEFAVGDLSGTNYGYLRWLTSTNTLTIKGAITATSLTLTGATVTGLSAGSVGGLATVATSGLKGDVGLGSVENYNAQYQAINGLQATATISSGGIAMSGGGFVKGGISWNTDKFDTSTSGFFMGYAGSAYRLFLGETGSSGIGGTNYLYWDGSELKVGGKIVGGTRLEAAPSGTTDGLVIASGIGIRTASSNQTLTITGGIDNGPAYGSQIDMTGTGASEGNRGVLMLQGGNAGTSGENGRIEFRTNIAGSGGGSGGSVRAVIKTDGQLIMPKNTVTGPSGDTYTVGSGCAEFQGNVSVGRSFAQINSTGGNAGNLDVAFRITVYGLNGATPAEKIILEKKGTGTNEGVIYLKNNANTTKVTLDASNGDVSADSFTTLSSRKFKTKIKKLKSGIDTVNKLNPVSFKRKGKNGKQDIGLIAEEVNKIIPQIVGKDEDGQITGLDYSKLTTVLVQAIKELKKEIDKLKNKIK